MKQKDILIIVVVGIVSGFVSLLASHILFTQPKNRQQQVEVVPVISTSFPTPNPKYFNNSAINPTQLVQIGSNSNPTPFN